MVSPGNHFGSSWQARCAQKTPKSTLKTPKWANLIQLGPNLETQRPPNPSQTQPKTLPDPLLQQVWRFCRPFQHLHRFSFDFLNNFKELKTCKIIFFPRENAIFYKIAIFDKNAKNILKILFKPSQNPPKPSPNPPKIHSKSIRNPKKSITAPKKRRGSAQERKIAPTWPGPPPPRRPTPCGRTRPGEGFSGFY